MLFRRIAVALGALVLAGFGFANSVGAEQPQIGEGSCSGTRACEGLTGTVGENSCNGVQACLNASGTIGNNSCNGPYADYGDYVCRYTGGSIRDGSCNMPGN